MYVISDLNGEKIVRNENKSQKTTQEEFMIEKVIKIKGDRLHIKWKDYDSLFKSWINMGDIA